MEEDIIEQAVFLLSQMQGVGKKSAKRMLLHFIENKDSTLLPLINTLQSLYNNIKSCDLCNNFDTQNPCKICSSKTRDITTICIVEDISSLWAIENTNSYNGLYFILGGRISAINSISPENINLSKLQNIIKTNDVKEVILATSSTIEGQITSNYIYESIKLDKIKFTMLAQGIPVGGELDYLDEITLSTALSLRKDL